MRLCAFARKKNLTYGASTKFSRKDAKAQRELDRYHNKKLTVTVLVFVDRLLFLPQSNETKKINITVSDSRTEYSAPAVEANGKLADHKPGYGRIGSYK